MICGSISIEMVVLMPPTLRTPPVPTVDTREGIWVRQEPHLHEVVHAPSCLLLVSVSRRNERSARLRPSLGTVRRSSLCVPPFLAACRKSIPSRRILPELCDRLPFPARAAPFLPHFHPPHVIGFGCPGLLRGNLDCAFPCLCHSGHYTMDGWRRSIRSWASSFQWLPLHDPDVGVLPPAVAALLVD